MGRSTKRFHLDPDWTTRDKCDDKKNSTEVLSEFNRSDILTRVYALNLRGQQCDLDSGEYVEPRIVRHLISIWLNMSKMKGNALSP
ncbi:hypothetical protein PCASD_04797 [Puccinia coronata f. sp. avenae]|nr:hypothetical protein PCASD_04797 [Puccinia coronata f. sp. avenae]